MEKAVQFSVNGKKLFGIVHLPEIKNLPDTIILMVTGGPQTRVGSHRLYVQLARFLSENGIASFRFDYEGTGDSEGEWVGYRYAGDSIQSAIDYIHSNFPEIKKIIIWALCDGATSSLVFAAKNPENIHALILCNPYLFHTEGKAKTILKYYYGQRFFEMVFWKKLFSGKFDFKKSIRSFVDTAQESRGNGPQVDHSFDKSFFGLEYEIPLEDVISAILNIKHKVTYLLSTNDLAAKQFEELLKSKKVKKVLKKQNTYLRYIKNADHTFSTSQSKHAAFRQTFEEIKSIY